MSENVKGVGPHLLFLKIIVLWYDCLGSHSQKTDGKEKIIRIQFERIEKGLTYTKLK
jgi:hypothetical protein